MTCVGAIGLWVIRRRIATEIPNLGQWATIRRGVSISPQFMRKLGGVIVNPRHLLSHFSDAFELIFQERLGHDFQLLNLQ
jgi:hypothetical protein